MAQQQYTLFKKFIGYGHYKLIIADKEGTRMEAVTGDMDLISRLSSVRDNAGKMTNSNTCFTYVLH